VIGELALLVTAIAPQDSIYADRATAELVSVARQRHAELDTAVHDYRALVRSRLDVSLGRSRFARLFPLIATEHLARVHWAYPNDLKIDMIGQRGASISREVRADVRLDRPWFIARGLGDSIRLIEDGEVPERAALHPFAAGAEEYYRYAITDSLGIRLPERLLMAVAIDVAPRRLGPSLIAGRIWVDRATGDVVRLTLFFLGEYLWSQPDGQTADDSSKARRESELAARVVRVEADIEYALFEQRYWMPFTQFITLHIHDPWITGAILPVRFRTTFNEYEINTGQPIRFALALEDSVTEAAEVDSSSERGAQVRAGRRPDGGRWEVTSPSLDSLEAYSEWPDSLALDLEPGDERRFRDVTEELAHIGEDLPNDWMGRGRPRLAQFGDIFRYNRVQGVSLGLTGAWQPGPAFTTVYLSARYGLTDGRFLPQVAIRRDAPSGLWELRGGRALADVDPFSSGMSLANSVNALFTGHDDADYMVTQGARVTRSIMSGWDVEWSVHAGFEEQKSVQGNARSIFHDLFFGDGDLPPNPPIRNGSYAVTGIKVDGRHPFKSWTVGVDGQFGEGIEASRAWGRASFWAGPLRLGVVGGAATRNDVPQMLLRAGGPSTVRGYHFGTKVGEAMWAAQLEFAFRPERTVQPIVFADAGNAARFSEVFRASPLIGVGGGVAFSLLITEFRATISKSVGANHDQPVRIDLLFRAVR
jgi:hypothetical protein